MIRNCHALAAAVQPVWRDRPEIRALLEAVEAMPADSVLVDRKTLANAHRLLLYSAKALRASEGEDSVLCELISEEHVVAELDALLKTDE